MAGTFLMVRGPGTDIAAMTTATNALASTPLSHYRPVDDDLRRSSAARTRVRPVARADRLNLAARKTSAAVFTSGTDHLGVLVAFAGSDG